MQTFLISFESTIREYLYGRKYPQLKKLKVGQIEDVYLCASTHDTRLNTNIKAHLGILDEMFWGFRGQGPYNLALNLLYTFTSDEKFAREHVIEFRQDFLENIDSKISYVIPSGLIMDWISSKQTMGGVHVQ